MYSLKRMFKSLCLAGMMVVLATSASAQDWRTKYPVVKFAASSSENREAVQARFKEFSSYFKKQLGVELQIYQATDYAGAIQALTSGQVHLASLGPAGYAAAWVDSEGAVEPLVAAREADGDMGYYSALIVRADSPYRKVEDLKGKTLGWADPNSTSGYLVPLVSLRAIGIEPEKFFERTVFSGSHENNVIGVLNGTFDSAFVWTGKDPASRGILKVMSGRGLVNLQQVRVIWTSQMIPSSPITVRKDMPADMKRDIAKLFVDLYAKNPKMAEIMATGKTAGFVEVQHVLYQPVLDVLHEQRRNRKKN
jgi:phosphonate transport system substrate-binding protein